MSFDELFTHIWNYLCRNYHFAMTPQQQAFLRSAYQAAVKSGHIFPEIAACEAALESAYGTSELAKVDNNLFGMKQHQHPIFGTHNLPTKECVNGQWKATSAAWVSYPSWTECFADRIATLKRLASVRPNYATALSAGSGPTYAIFVSKTWSTDPQRAEKVLTIYDDMLGGWDANPSVG